FKSFCQRNDLCLADRRRAEAFGSCQTQRELQSPRIQVWSGRGGRACDASLVGKDSSVGIEIAVPHRSPPVINRFEKPSLPSICEPELPQGFLQWILNTDGRP